mmetsp:Transcript_58517/g.143478  ORF Transcript_58517/g.143478 Transcript_58517/m.143478 type:complete len:99 (-) Transcript_58517:299-595(-)
MGLCTEVWDKTRNGSVPSVPRMQGLISLLLNIFFSGMGSVFAGLVANDMATTTIGILQFFLWPTLIGWIWSVWWGILIFNKSKHHEAVLLGISIYSQA